MRALQSGYARRSATHTLMCLYTVTGTHVNTDTIRAILKHAQIHLSSHLLIVFLLICINMSPNSCSGACANAHPQSSPHTNPAECNMNLEPHTIIILFYLSGYFLIRLYRSAPNSSVLAAIQRRAQKRRCGMSRTGTSNRQLLRRPAWTDRGMGRIKRRQYHPDVLI